MEKQRSESGSYCCSYAWLLRRNFLIEKQTTRPLEGCRERPRWFKGYLVHLEAALTDTWIARVLEHLRDGGATTTLSSRRESAHRYGHTTTALEAASKSWTATLTDLRAPRYLRRVRDLHVST
jgi:hypothetical protein